MPPRKKTSAGTARPELPAANSKAKKRRAADDNKAGRVRPTKRSRTSEGPEQARDNKLRQAETPAKAADGQERPIIINRAPVLELWGACVARFLHPDFSWELCLSIGSSIATITAIAKGRSIGKVAPPTKPGGHLPEKQDKKGDHRLPTVEVTGFPMAIKGDSVIVKGKPKKTREVNLVRKYGSAESYGEAKAVMLESLQSWRGKEG